MGAEYRHFLAKVRQAKAGGIDAWRPMSTGEKVAVALALNRAEWLTTISYTIPQAIDRMESGGWPVSFLLRAERDTFAEV